MPLIACIHGGGSTAEIYKSQCAQLERLLAPDFRLVYFDGPFEHPPGYGILPAFRDYAPFKSWFKKDDMGNELSDGSGFDLIGRDGIERLLDLMEKQGDAADYVGAIGFSQGSRVVGGLLLDQQRREILGDHRNINLSFGVLCMGSGPPMESEIGHQIDESSRNEPIKIPTLHVHGLRDMVYHLSVNQTEMYYDAQSRRVLEVDYHHAMPWVRSDVQKLASDIRSLYRP